MTSITERVAEIAEDHAKREAHNGGWATITNKGY